MPQLDIARPFTLNRQDGTSQVFGPGPQEVSPADADHWFVKAHLTDPNAPQTATAAEVAELRTRLADAELRLAASGEAISVDGVIAPAVDGVIVSDAGDQRAVDAEAAKAGTDLPNPPEEKQSPAFRARKQ